MVSEISSNILLEMIDVLLLKVEWALEKKSKLEEGKRIHGMQENVWGEI